MVIDLNKTHQSEGDDLDLKLYLAPPSSLPTPRHNQQRSEEPSPLQQQSKHIPCTRSVNDRPIGFQCDRLPIEPLGTRLICPQEAMIHELAPLQLRSFQQEPSQPWPILEPWPARGSPLDASVPTPPSKRRQYKRKANDDISTEPVPSPCSSSSTNHPEPAATKVRRKRSKADDKEIEPAYPWSTNRRAKIHTMEYLRSNNIVTITGEVECNQCKEKYDIEYDLESKFEELARFIARKGEDCNNRAPSSWSTPVPLDCKMCNQQNCVAAVIPKSDFNTINWLFLLLGQMLGNLQLDQLKYFCTHTNHHRTGAKDRLLYLTYITLCEQLNG